MGQRINYDIPLSIENAAREYLNIIYKNNGFTIERIKGIQNIKYDLVLRKNNIEIKIEEKAASYYWPFMIFEEHQDFPFWDGWIFKTEADFIIYFYFKENEPYICYSVNWKKAYKFYNKTREEWQSYENKNYKGHTVGIKIPWDVLVYYNIAKILEKYK